jgi:allene oxide cyclase-like protein
MRTLIVLVAALAVALSVTVTSASALSRPQTFSLIEVSEQDISINGFSFQRLPEAGDRFGFVSGLYKWAGRKRGARVGRDEGICTFLKASESEQAFSAVAHCVAEVYLPAGQILVEGFAHFSESASVFNLPVTGGTGAYANARGYVRISDLPSGNSNLEFHLLP